MLKINLKNIPEKPGVYRFLDSRNKIIYIGQSSCLQKRIASHLKARDPKTKRFIQVSKRIKFQTTATVEDALILEAKLIKKYWPIYNIKEKDDRSWIYIIIPRVEWPKPLLVRSKELGRHIIARTALIVA
jgi:excinuclease ABC subunit C